MRTHSPRVQNKRVRPWPALLLVLGLTQLAIAAGPQDAQRQEHFDRDPGWEAYHNRLLPERLPVVRQDFGYRTSRQAGGRAGEVGGWVQRSVTPASYAKRIPACTLRDRLRASGRFAVTRADNGSGVLFGWFHDTSRGWRTPNSLAFRIDGNGEKYWVLFEYGTKGGRTGGGATFEGRYQTTTTKPFLADGTSHTWSLNYDPDGNGGDGEITFVLDGQSYTAGLLPGHKDEGAEFNRFGLWNQQVAGEGMEIYFDDLVVGDAAESFDRDPVWSAVCNRAEVAERFVRPKHDFGLSRTRHAGGDPGEIGGIFWRGTPPASYADRVGPLTLNDELTASGRIVMQAAAVDSAVHFGWFQAAAVKEAGANEGRGVRRSFLGICVEGLSRDGHYFRPEYATSDGTGRLRPDGPLLRPDGQTHSWSLKYDPQGAGGRGRITFRLDDAEATFDLEAGHRERAATFDRFGFVVLPGADGHFVEAYLDDLSYTVSPR